MQTPMQRAAVAGSRRRSIVKLLILVMIVAASYGVRAFVTRTRVPTSAGPSGWTIYHDPTHGWTMQFPNGWHARGIKEYVAQVRRDAGARGVLITNVGGGISKGSGVGAFNFDGLPPTLVAVQITTGIPPWGTRPCADTPSPLSLLRASRTTTATGANGTTQLKLETSFTSHGNRYGLQAWIGSRASKVDRDRLDRMVASISFAGAKRARSPEGTGCSDNL